MFGLQKKKKCDIYSPVKGRKIDIYEVPDPVFSKKMMGEGVGLIFNDDILYSPVDGIVQLVAQTKHAIGFIACNDAEILLHIGLDTVSLAGEGFEVLVCEGDKVKHGTPIIKIDRALMETNNIDLTTPLVITNNDYSVTMENHSEVTTDSIIMTCHKK
ncbi:hypothetical protein A4S06_00315 [Erysipelotrichaceae bacterium MTC7]|nr:hypothetical protein A4S06_00315 [Erysipelotrichaceae bacterium MTC7]